MSRFSIALLHQAGDWSSLGPVEGLEAALLEPVAHAIAEHPTLGPRFGDGAVCCVLSNDAEVATLNEKFRGKAAPTNVLSFPASPKMVAIGELGDVIMAIETVQREAQELAISLAHHVQHLLVHGMLHLVGYDHAIAAEAEEMERHETEVLTRLGIADPYAGELA